jgi:hypothetical protein
MRRWNQGQADIHLGCAQSESPHAEARVAIEGKI